MPASERRGRVHSSTVTVAVLDTEASTIDASFARRSPSDFAVEWFHGTVKAGGQHRNKHACSARVRHLPTGLVETRQGRDRTANLREAMAALERALDDAEAAARHGATAAVRRDQVGSGMRADKTVTLRFQDDQAVHHLTGKTMRASDYLAGHMDRLWR